MRRRGLLLLLGATMCLLLHSLLCALSGIVSRDGEAARLQEVMSRHERRMNTALDSLSYRLTHGADPLVETLDQLAGASANDYAFYLFRNNYLLAWRHACLTYSDISPSAISVPLANTDNGVFYVVRRDVDGITTLFALLRVRSHYSFDNDYLESQFHPSFGLPAEASLSLRRVEDAFQVRDETGRFLFSVVVPSSARRLTAWHSVADCLLLLGWVCLMALAIVTLFNGLLPRWRMATALTLAAALLAALYLGTVALGAPLGLHEAFCFNVETFAYDWWLPSLAHFALLNVLVFVWCYIFYHHLSLRMLARHRKGFGRAATGIAAIVGLPLTLFLCANIGIDALVHHSRDLLAYIGELDLSGTSLVKLFILAVAMMSFLMVCEKVYAVVAIRLTLRQFGGLMLIGAVLSSLLTWALNGRPEWTVTLGFALFSALFYATKNSSPDTWRFNHFVWGILLAASFVFLRLTWLNETRERENRQVLATNLSMQLLRDDDPIGERILPDVEAELLTDTTLQALLANEPIDDMQLFAYIRGQHFSRYFANYNLQVIPCQEPSSLITISNTGQEYYCQAYFDDLLAQQGRAVRGSKHFHCLLDGNGLPSYLGGFLFNVSRFAKQDKQVALYVQLDSRALSPPGVGYPELLTNKRDRLDNSLFKGYSYARYFDGHLSQHYGDFDYPLLRAPSDTCTIVYEEREGYSHLVCPPYQQQMVVLSYPVLTVTQAMTDFSYLTLAFLLVCSFLLYLSAGRSGSFIALPTIGERIQIGFVSFVMALFAVVTIVTVGQAATSFEEESRSRMSHVLNSIGVAMESDFPDLTADVMARIPYALDAALHRDAALFKADAHIYNLEGRLAGTSKRELFKNGLMAPLMNDAALAALANGRATEVFATERIGTFSHYSIYAPLLGAEGHTIGYVNVPYFTDLATKHKQLFSTLLPIANAMMIIIMLSIVFSFFLSRAVLTPLSAMRDSLRSVDLNRRLSKLTYKADDEVGQMVGAYNRMTDQLRVSAERLATTEREATWREMARQIAHEIKNPLTPMKLSVQYMLKVWESRPEAFEPVLRKTSTTLVEQIDQLAAVATQFGDVAKMRQRQPERFDLAQRLERIVGLFANSEEATVDYRGPLEGIYITADPDQIASVFNNLIKNALQSAQKPRQLHVLVTLATQAGNAVVCVADNGDGIPAEIQEKIFRPNFTTKSTGMGLGLAISKTVAVNAGGDISFTTAPGQGTTFKVELPCEHEISDKG